MNYAKLYLDWVNNFLSVDGFAEYYGISRLRAIRIIKVGKCYHERGLI